jgi:hypothetical protein
MFRTIAGITALSIITTAQAQTAQGDLSVTIYNNDVALVQDIRQMSLPSGISRQEFPDVSAQIASETVSLAGDGFAIVEQNFDYDLLSPAALMQKAVGTTLSIVRTNPATGAEVRERAKILAVNGGVILQIGERIEILRDDGLPVRVVFDAIPPNLRARPTLSITLDTEKPGLRPLMLSYLTSGMSWAADYVAMFDDAKGQVDVQGWITLNNKTGTTFTNAKLFLVAGSTGSLRVSNNGNTGGTRSSAGTEAGKAEQLGDLNLYPMDVRTTVANAQTKQLSFLSADNVPAQKTYQSVINWRNNFNIGIPAQSTISFSTGKSKGVGDAMPAGVVRVYMRDARGEAKFVGETRIDHTSAGAEVDLVTGLAFDVKVQPVVEKREQVNEGEWKQTSRYRIVDSAGRVTTTTVETPDEFYRTTMRYIVTNARSKPVTVTVKQQGLGSWTRETRVTSESIEGKQEGDDTRKWEVPVAANSKTELLVTYVSSF